MSTFDKQLAQEILNLLGQAVVTDVRDKSLKIAMDIATYRTPNQIKLTQYSSLATLNSQQKESLCDLLSETITDTIYRFFELLEENPENFKLFITKDGIDYNMANISEKMGSEIACYENGWIQRYSKIGRFIL